MALSAISPERRRWLTLVAALLGWMFDGMEMGLFPLIARPALQDMQATMGNTDAGFIGHWTGIITACFLVGAACGGGLFGWLGDRVGRMRALSLSILTYSLCSGLAYFAQTPTHLGALRFLAALGMGGEWALGIALVMEVWPEKHRSRLAGVLGAVGNVGFLVMALVGWNFKVTADSWRWVALVGATPALITFFVRLFVPESEKWQHATAAKPSHPVRELFSGHHVGRVVVVTLLASVVLIGTWGSVQWLPSWADKLTDGQNPDAKAMTQALSALGATLACFLGAWLGGRVGRRWAYVILCVVSLAACQYMFRTVDSFGPTFLVMTFIVGGITAAFYGWFPLYLPELFPTRVRATAQGFSFNAGRILAAVGALQMGALMRTFDGSYAQAGAVITLVYVVGLVAIWLAPETRGRTLPE
jgi:MFS transporter, SHS family, sialic acid transporter